MSNDNDVPAVTENPGRTKRRAKPKEILGSKQEKAMCVLLSNRTYEEAARESDVSVRTIYRWLEEPAFSEEYRMRRRALFSLASARLQLMSSPAATILGKLMLDPATPPASRIRAADSILNHGTKTIEMENVEAVVLDLVRAADETKPGWRKK
jgi:hypothetical protein